MEKISDYNNIHTDNKPEITINPKVKIPELLAIIPEGKIPDLFENSNY